MRPGFPDQQMTPSSPPASVAELQQHNNTTAAASTWRSPVPYLFGGLAAMLGLIAFALLVLACSYWRISGSFLDGGGGDDDEVDSSTTASGGDTSKPVGRKPAPCLEEGFVVIMAGDDKPTFLATPRPPPPPFGSLDSTGGDGKATGEAAEEEKEGKGTDDNSPTPTSTGVDPERGWIVLVGSNFG